MAKYQTATDIGGTGDGLKEPGVYHMVVTEVHDGESNKGKAIDGFTIDLVVQNDDDQKDKEFHLALFNAESSKSQESQDWSIKKQTAFFVAANLMRPDQLGTEVEFDLAKAVGHQIIIDLQAEEYEGKTNLRLAYANIYHVDDPRAAKHPKNAASLAIIPAEFRHEKDSATYFEKVLGKRPGGNGSAKSSPAKTLTEGDLAGL